MAPPAQPPPAPPGGCKRAIVWLRRDLRLADNPALTAALRLAPEVIPVYIWAPEEEGQFQPGRCSRWWLAASLASLDAELRARGSRLLAYRAPDSKALLCQLAAAHGCGAVLFNHLYDPISMVRDNEVKSGLAAAGIYCQSFNADTLREPWEVLDSGGKPFTSFDGFWGAHCGLPRPPASPLGAPDTLPPLPPGMEGLPLKQLGVMTAEEELSNAQLEFHWHPGSAGAHRLLEDFVRGGRLRAFDKERAKVDRASTSRLSPHIHYGEISTRAVYAAAKAAEAEWARAAGAGADGGRGSVADFLRQLGYREYSRYLSFHFPFTHERSLLEHLRAVPWRFDQRLFKAWRQGRTGYPLVDAAMREVWGTGWMHNRMRVVAASFMVKNLLLPWQWGLKHYWDALLDADLESDALGWQYVSGCMADAHDFSHAIDHAAEAQRFDPKGHYVRRWLPVLARLPAQYIHEPWAAPEGVLADAGVELGVNYPWPVVTAEESAMALRAANAVVQECQQRAAAAAAAAGGTPAPASGPFRPATDASPAEAERLFMDNYRQSLMQEDGSGAAPVGDRGEGSAQSEDVQSNLVLPSEGQEAQGPVRRRPQQQQAQQAGSATMLPPGLREAAAQPAATTQTGAHSAAFAPALLAPVAELQRTVLSPAAVEMEAEQAAAAVPPPAPQPMLDMHGWHQLQTTPIGGSLPAAGSGSGDARGSHDRSGHATMTGVVSAEPGALRSLGAGGSGSQTPLDSSPQLALQRAPQALLPVSSSKLGGGAAAALPGQCEALSPHAGHKRQRSASPQPAAEQH